VSRTCDACAEGTLVTFADLGDIPVLCGVHWADAGEAAGSPVGRMTLGYCPNCAYVRNLAFDPAVKVYDKTMDTNLHFSPAFQALMLSAATLPLSAQSGPKEASDITDLGDRPGDWSDWVSEGTALNSAGNYSAAARALRQALALAEGANAPERRVIKIYEALASADANAGQYAESEHEYERALVLTEKAQGRQSLDYALLVASMAVLPTQTENRHAVVALLHEAITVNGRSGSARELAIVRICLAQILVDERRYVEAESVLLVAQTDFTNLKATNPKLVAELLHDFGVLRFRQARYDEAVSLYTESIRLLAHAMGDKHPSLVVPFNNLALSYLKLGRLNDAELTLKHAIAVCSKTLGDDHPTLGTLLEGYAVVLRKLHRNGEAKAVAAKSREIDRASRTRNGVGATISVTGLRTRSNNVP